MDNFAVFILTHERANDQKSYKTFRNAGYTGKIYFVVDDKDRQIDEYKQYYGENVLVFSKEKYFETTDTFFNKKIEKAVVYARNVCFDFASKLGIDYFVNCDDDIKSLVIKMPQQDGSLKTYPLKNMDKMLEAYIEFMKTSKCDALSICEEGAYIGGVNTSVQNGRHWSMAHFFLFDSKSKLRFRSVFNEDVIFAVTCNMQGKRIFTPTFIAESLPARIKDAQTGGMTDTYKSLDRYITVFTHVIANPGCMKIKWKDGIPKSGRIPHSVVVQILSEEWKK